MKKLFGFVLLVSSLAFAQKTNVQDVNGIRYSDSYQWKAKPAADLSVAGTGKTLTLPSKILGIDVSLTSLKPYYVYIYGVGTPEAALVTGGTYTSAAGGTVIVTTVNAHAAGYSVGSASAGIQEALNDAGSPNAHIIIPPVGANTNAYQIYARISVRNSRSLIEGYGALLKCYARDTCMFIGDPNSSTAVGSVRLQGLRFASGLTSPGVSITNTDIGSAGANIATFTTGSPHGFVVGDWVVTQNTLAIGGGGGDWPFTGLFVVASVPDSTHFTAAKTHANVASRADAGGVALAHAAIAVQAQETNIVDTLFPSGTAGGGTTGKFHNGIINFNDQHLTIHKISNEGSGTSFLCDANYCSPVIYGPGPFTPNAGIFYVEDAELSMQCGGNGIDNNNNNTIKVLNSVIQGQSQFGIRSGSAFANNPALELDNVYFEGACTNPIAGLGQAGVIVKNGWAKITGGEPVSGSTKLYSNTGATTYYYMIVHKAGGSSSAPYLAGYSTSNGITAVPVTWPQNDPISTYDVIRTTDLTPWPYTGICTGGSQAACGSVALGVTSASCTGGVCSISDNVAASTTSYTFSTNTLTPQFHFWSGAYVLAGGAKLVIDSLRTNVVAGDSLVPKAFAQECQAAASGQPAQIVCNAGDSNVNNNPGVSAFILQNGGRSGGTTANIKGRINLLNSPAASLNTQHLVTLVDSSQEKTIATANYRPSNDANDTFIGLDQGVKVNNQAQLSFGAPVAISSYIGNVGDNTSYKERLTASLKTFKVAITTNSDVTMTGGTLNVAAALKTIPWRVANGTPSNADCTIDGQVYFQSDAPTLGQQLWFCKTNVWTLMTGGGSGGTWDTITSPGGNQSLSMGNFSSTWTGGAALTNPILTIQDTTADTYTGNLVQITSVGTSTAKGLGVTVPAGGTAATFQAGATGFAISVPSGQGNTGFNRLVSTSANAPTSGCSICFGQTDTIRYWNAGLGAAMVLAGGGAAGPAHIGDTPGIDIAGTLTSRTAGQGLTFVPLANTGNGAGGDLTLTAGNGAGTGKNGIVRLAGGTGGTGGRGLVSLGTSGSGASWVNDNVNPPTQYGPVCSTSASTAQECSAGALEGLVGICMDNCTNTGSSIVVSNQWARGSFDGATVTPGDYVSASTTPGLLTDVGPSPNTTAMTIGVVGSNISGNDWNVFVFPQSPVVSLSNVVVTNPSGGNVILSASPTQVPLTLQTAPTGTADIFLVKKGDGTTAMKVDTNGILTVGTGAGTITSTQFVSATANPASNAANNILRLAKTDLVAWRNNGNSNDLTMGVNNSDFLALNRMPGITINPNAGSFATTLTVTAPGQNQNLTIPDVGAATGTFVFQDFTQTLSKKSVSDALTFTNIATPPAPAAGFVKLYGKGNQICSETSAAAEICIAAGGGATVSSVGQTVNGGATSGIFTLSGGPVVASGTLDTAIAGTSGGVPYFSSGTVLSSSAALTSNSPVLGGGAGATPKTIAGITSDGTSVITVGVAGSTVGGIDFKNATSGTISLRPATGALGAVTWTIPAATDTAVGKATTDTLTNKTLTLPVIASISNSGTMTVPTGTDTLMGKATTDVMTNKTFDADAGTGNVLVSSSKLYIGAAGCQNATASLLWDSPTTNPAVAACDTGTNTQKGVANFADGANTLSMSTNFLLPSDWSGAIDAKFRWFTTATTGSVVWQIATICVADGETSDPAYNTSSTVTDAAKGTTLQDNDASIAGVTTTGCAAGEMMYVKVFRDPTTGADTLAATASLRGVELVIRRTQ